MKKTKVRKNYKRILRKVKRPKISNLLLKQHQLHLFLRKHLKNHKFNKTLLKQSFNLNFHNKINYPLLQVLLLYLIPLIIILLVMNIRSLNCIVHPLAHRHINS